MRRIELCGLVHGCSFVLVYTVTNVINFAVFLMLFHLLHSVITAELNLSRVFGGTAKTALKKCPWISVILVLTGEQHMLLLAICN